MQPPIIPEVDFEGDTSNFDNYENDGEGGNYADIGMLEEREERRKPRGF